MVFGSWYCPFCQKTLQVGTVAPRGVMNRHCMTAKHSAMVAQYEREKKMEDRETDALHAAESLDNT